MSLSASDITTTNIIEYVTKETGEVPSHCSYLYVFYFFIVSACFKKFLYFVFRNEDKLIMTCFILRACRFAGRKLFSSSYVLSS